MQKSKDNGQEAHVHFPIKPTVQTRFLIEGGEGWYRLCQPLGAF